MNGISALCLFVLATVNGLWTAQAMSDYCCTPLQYEIKIGQINGMSMFGYGFSQMNNMDAAIDHVNAKIGTEGDLYQMGQSMKVKTLTSFKEDVTYTVVDGICYKSKAVGADMACVPQSAHLDVSYYFGNSTRLNANSFSDNVQLPGSVHGQMFFSVAKEDCIPLSVTLLGTIPSSHNLGITSISGFYDFKDGISDPSRWFTVPDSCKQATIAGSHHSIAFVNGIPFTY